MEYLPLFGPFAFLVLFFIYNGFLGGSGSMLEPVNIAFFGLFFLAAIAAVVFSILGFVHHTTSWITWTTLIVHGLIVIGCLVIFFALFLGGGYHFG